MTDVQRYDLDHHGLHGADAFIGKDDEGDYVAFADYQKAVAALEAQSKEIEALRSALERIEGGRYPGITNLVLAGAWQEVVNTMQADARTALKGA